LFDDLYDALSLLVSWRWPEAVGEITEVCVERRPDTHGKEHFRLAVAYKFSVDEDGPYSGESFWEPGGFFPNRKVITARRKLRTHMSVVVRYRPDDPSVNRLDHREWKKL
jgi:hypothetical protein